MTASASDPSSAAFLAREAPRWDNADRMLDFPSAPAPEVDESPIAYADRAGTWYAALIAPDHRRSTGLYLTPPVVARFMAAGLKAKPGSYRLLDPSAGGGILVCAAVEDFAGRPGRPESLHVTTYEIDARLAGVLRQVLCRPRPAPGRPRSAEAGPAARWTPRARRRRSGTAPG